ncbi:MAG: response regulator [Calditrichaceae bacterium]
MKKIIFVDDEQHILDGYKRMLRPLCSIWDMYFVQSGKQALDIMEKTSVDVVVSDMRMPGMDGVQLLTTVMDKYPKVIRIILSGHSEQSLILKSIRPIHRYISKPCSAEELKTTIDNASKLHNMLEGKEIKALISQMDALPNQPEIYSKILKLVQEPESSLKDIGMVIEQDAGMSAQILKLVNSSYFGFFKRINSPVQATNLLGINTIRTLVLSHEIFSMFYYQQELAKYANSVVKISSMTGHFSRLIARETVEDAVLIEDAFMVGFLHDIGFLVLASKFPEELKAVIKQSAHRNLPVYTIEKEIFGATHSQIGAYLLALWGFADNITENIYNFPNTDYLSKDKIQIGHILHISKDFAHHLYTSYKDVYTYATGDIFLENSPLTHRRKGLFEKCAAKFHSDELK